MRGLIRFFSGLIVILAIIWGGLWWYAEGRLQSGFTAWGDLYASKGWKIAYDGMHKGTSPLAATLQIDNLILSPPPDVEGLTGTITLPSVTLRIDALDPLVLHTDLPPKILASISPNNADIAVTFGAAAASATLDPHAVFSKTGDPYRSGRFTASNVDVLASGSLLVLHVDAIDTHFAFNPDAGAAAPALNSSETVDGFALSPILTRLASIPFDGKISHLAFGLKLSGPVPDHLAGIADQFEAIPHDDFADQQKLLAPLVHQWAVQGGNGAVTVNAVVGPSTLAADAAVAFDANVQPAGTANLTADHIDEFTGALTAAYPALQAYVLQGEAMLSDYISSTDQGGQTLAMHAMYGAAGVMVNGKKISEMEKLDWTALENPPASQAPPQTPPQNNGQ